MKKRTIALLMAAVMLFGITVGGTIAWLSDTSTVVSNTFTVGDINIVLNETDIDNDDMTSDNVMVNGVARDQANKYKLVPGNTYIKDPKVTVKAGSEECYIFIRVDELNNTYEGLGGKIIQYEINTDDWTAVTGATGVYYYNKNTIDALNATSDVFVDSTVLATTSGKEITINSGLTKTMLEAIDKLAEDKEPQIKFTAYAVQAANMTDANDAWNKAFGTTTTTP